MPMDSNEFDRIISKLVDVWFRTILGNTTPTEEEKEKVREEFVQIFHGRRNDLGEAMEEANNDKKRALAILEKSIMKR